MKTLIATIILMAITSTAHAGMYKCEVGGSTTYQDTPCQTPDAAKPLHIVITAGVEGANLAMPSSDGVMKYNYTPQWSRDSSMGGTSVVSGREIDTQWYTDQHGNKLVKTYMDGELYSQQFIK